MHICISGPISLNLVNHSFDMRKVPSGYPFPPMSQFANAFLKKGHKVSVVTYSTGIEKPIILENEKISFYIAKRRENKAARDFFKYEVKQMVDFFNSIKCDIVSTHWTYEISLAAIHSLQKKVSIRLHDNPPLIFRLNPHPYKFIRMLIHYYVVNKAKYLNANSHYTFSNLSNNIKNKTSIIPNFLSDEICYKPIQNKDNYIVTVSQGFKGRKNIARSILAFAGIRKYFRDLEYYLIGYDLEEGGAAYRFAKRKGISAGIKFLGEIPYDKTIDLISRAKLMLHPSIEESFGMSVLEAMALGTPVIGGDKAGNIPYLLGLGKYGTLCNVFNYIDIKSKLKKSLEDYDNLIYLTTKAKEHILKCYSETVVINKFEDYFSKIIND